MISGAHAIIYTKNAEADKAFFKDILKLPNVDVGRGWLIFGLPPSEIAMHPTDEKSYHELYLMCDDIELFISKMTFLKIACSAASDQGWGIVSELTLPGGGRIGVYQPRHARPQPASVGFPVKRSAGRSAKPAVKSRPGTKISSKKTAAKKSVIKSPAKTKKAAPISKKSAPVKAKPKAAASKSKTAKARKK
jgi:hypothetical protein